MAESFEIAGFVVSLEGDEALCRFASRPELGVEPPAGVEQAFAAEFQPGGRLSGRRLVVALDDVPAVSSRQLGALLGIYRAAGGGQKLPTRGIRPNVRELFEMTRMGEFFDY